MDIEDQTKDIISPWELDNREQMEDVYSERWKISK